MADRLISNPTRIIVEQVVDGPTTMNTNILYVDYLRAKRASIL